MSRPQGTSRTQPITRTVYKFIGEFFDREMKEHLILVSEELEHVEVNTDNPISMGTAFVNKAFLKDSLVCIYAGPTAVSLKDLLGMGAFVYKAVYKNEVVGAVAIAGGMTHGLGQAMDIPNQTCNDAIRLHGEKIWALNVFGATENFKHQSIRKHLTIQALSHVPEDGAIIMPAQPEDEAMYKDIGLRVMSAPGTFPAGRMIFQKKWDRLQK
ncbi:hypothetical protein F4777DRAFT_600539 [Nemania sp. FL0916]|nr:hypothetical protein F4777DRAFT_600539 [Nemania sp. FL0916]